MPRAPQPNSADRKLHCATSGSMRHLNTSPAQPASSDRSAG